MGINEIGKTEENLRKEIEELQRIQWEITERLRDPRGIRRGGLASKGTQNFNSNGAGNRHQQRGFVRPGGPVDPEDQLAPKRRLLSAVVKVEDGEEVKGKEVAIDNDEMDANVNDNDGTAAVNESGGHPGGEFTF